MSIDLITKDLNKLKNPAKARLLAKFFKTGKGEYGEGDVFWGISVPEQRKVAEKYTGMDLADVEKLLQGRIHEHRLTALLIAVLKYLLALQDQQEQPRLPNILNYELINFLEGWADFLLGEAHHRRVTANG